MKTPRTSRMCWRSFSSSTGVPATSTAKSGGPITRSLRIEPVAARRSVSLKPVQAAASERPCSKDTQSGFRNSGIVTAMIANAVATAMTRSAARPAR